MSSIDIFRTGPIAKGEIDLAPLTILAGPNGSGKSYAAMILHSMNGEGIHGNLNYFLSQSVENEIEEELIGDLQEVEIKLRENSEATISSNHFNNFIQAYYTVVFEQRLNDSLESVFATDLTELIKEGHRCIRFDIEDELGDSRLVYYSSYDGLELQEYPKVEDDPLLVLSDDNQEFESSSEDREIVPVEIQNSDKRALSPVSTIIRSIFDFIQSKMGLRHGAESHYLPAGRAGLLQSHEVLTTGAFDRLSRVGLEPIEVPAFSGVVSGYLSQIVELSSSSKGELSDLAQELEKEALDGNVFVEKDEEKPNPKITFEQSGREFQLHLASTSVSELAPLILYTKFVLSKNSTIVIEEPEAHLHPENQRKVAYFIVKLVQEGVRVVVTTHSDFFIEQLNNCIRVSQVERDIREDSELNELPSISPENVSVHAFQSDGDEEYQIEKVNIDKIQGIPTDEFDRVSDELYGESYKIDRLLEKSMNE